MKSAACLTGHANASSPVMPYASASAIVAMPWLYIVSPPISPPSSACRESKKSSPLRTTSRYCPGSTCVLSAARKPSRARPVVAILTSTAPCPPHAPHSSSNSTESHRPSACWCRASQFSAAATARSVSRSPPRSSTIFRRCSTDRCSYGISGWCTSTGILSGVSKREIALYVRDSALGRRSRVRVDNRASRGEIVSSERLSDGSAPVARLAGATSASIAWAASASRRAVNADARTDAIAWVIGRGTVSESLVEAALSTPGSANSVA